MPEYEPRNSGAVSAGHGDIAGVRPAGPAPAPEVTWGASMLESDPLEAARAFDRAVHGLARRLPAGEAARFLFALDSALYARLGAAAIAAEGEKGPALHPKHRLTKYHDFFLTRIGPQERVADLGCGGGSLAVDIARECGARVVGVDLSEEALVQARARASGADLGSGSVEFARADIMEIAAGGEWAGIGTTFDVVVLSNVLEHLRDRARTLRGLMACLRATRVLIRVPAYERDWRVAYKRDLGVEWRLDPTHEIEHTREELGQEVLAAGLWIESLDHRWGEYYMVARAR